MSHTNYKIYIIYILYKYILYISYIYYIYIYILYILYICKLQDLRNHMLITEPSSSELHSIYLSQAEKLQHVTSRKKRSTKQPETIVEDQEELLDHENAPRTQNTSLSNDKTLFNILEGLIADNIEPQQLIDLQFHQSLDESNNSQLRKREWKESSCRKML